MTVAGNPNNAIAWFCIGLILLNLGRQEGAKKAFSMSHAEKRPFFIDRKTRHGAVYYNRPPFPGESPKAIRQRSRKEMAGEWYGKGIELYHENRNEEALMAFDRALMYDRDNASAYYKRGLALTRLNLWKEALSSFNHTIRLDPGNAHAWNNKAIIHKHEKEYEDAIAAIDAAIRYDPSHATAWYNRGLILMKLNRHTEALGSFERATLLEKGDETGAGKDFLRKRILALQAKKGALRGKRKK